MTEGLDLDRIRAGLNRMIDKQLQDRGLEVIVETRARRPALPLCAACFLIEHTGMLYDA